MRPNSQQHCQMHDVTISPRAKDIWVIWASVWELGAWESKILFWNFGHRSVVPYNYHFCFTISEACFRWHAAAVTVGHERSLASPLSQLPKWWRMDLLQWAVLCKAPRPNHTVKMLLFDWANSAEECFRTDHLISGLHSDYSSTNANGRGDLPVKPPKQTSKLDVRYVWISRCTSNGKRIETCPFRIKHRSIISASANPDVIFWVGAIRSQ